MFRLSIQFLIAGLLTLPGIATAAGSVKLPATTQAACFDENGNPRSCNGTGEDGEKQAGAALPAARFNDNNNGTVTDKLTGLIWSKHANAPSRAMLGDPSNGCPDAETSMTWLQALDFVACLNATSHAGATDWRLPNLNELESIVNPGVADTSAYLNANGFGLPGMSSSQVQPGRYWSSTSDASGIASQSADAAWDVDMVKGDSPASTLKNDLEFLPRAVWPVRGTASTSAELWQTGQALCFDEVGDSRTCKGTEKDGENPAGAISSTQRFKPNSKTTLAFDKSTGLIWTTATQTPGPDACPDAEFDLTWQQALDHVACLNARAFLGHSDWRLPNRKELRSLVDYSRGAPALSAGHPFDDLKGNKYWSSTTDLSSPTDAWSVSMFDGSLSSAVKADGILPVWPVCDADLVPPALTINQGNMATKVATQTISGTVDEGATVTVSVKGGTPVAATVTGTTWSFTTDPLAVGVNDITVSATNFSQNIKTAAISVTLDTVAPALSLNPVTALTNKKSHTLSGTVEAGATMAVTMGTTPLLTTVSGTTWSAVIPALAEGANTIAVTATDAAGNTATLPLATITLDTIPPVTTAAPASGNFTDSVTVSLTATKAGSTIHYTTDGTPVTTDSPVYSAPIKLAATTTTPFTVQFMAVDQLGNAEPVNNTAYMIHLGCDLNGDGKVDVTDALKALQISIGLSSATPYEMIRGDVGPLVSGKPNPNGTIDLADTLVVLQRSLGLVQPW